MAIQVLIVDDHAIIRDGLKALLEKESKFVVVGEAENGFEAIELMKKVSPDVILLDIAMPGMNGIQAAREILETQPEVKIIILSMYATSEIIHQALKAGVLGYLIKDAAGEEVISALESVYKGRRYFSTSIKEVLNRDARNTQESKFKESPLDSLSDREREVLQLVVEGHTSLEIGHILSLSPKTVETYRSRLMSKLKVENIPELVKFAIRHGLTPNL